jgi:hypothetical protein
MSVRVTGLIFRDRIVALGADAWQVGAYQVVVNAHTQRSGALGLGSEVEVVARQLSDGAWLALRITLISSTITPTPPLSPPTVAASGTPSAPPITNAPTTTMPETSTTPLPLTTPRPTGTPGVSPEASPLAATPSRTPTVNPVGSNTLPPPLLTLTPLPSDIVEPTETAEPPEVEFEGLVTDINGGVWTIGGRVVQVTGDTQFEDNPGLGSYVDVNAWQYPNGTLVARRIRVR